MSTLLEFARREMRAAGLYDEDADYGGGAIASCVEEVVKVIDSQQHSGGSIMMVAGILGKLIRYEPLTPLTGADDEWVEVSDSLWQNRRCGRVFKGDDGIAYDIEAIVFCEPDGGCYTSRDSRMYVTFPYIPTTEYVNVGERP